MKVLKDFKDFLEMKVVVRRSPDVERAKDLILGAEKKLAFFNKLKLKIGLAELDSNYIVDACYDIIFQLIRAKMLIDGYKTDSHEVEVSYLKVLGFLEAEVLFANQLRYFRNGTKYYGTILDKEYAEKVLNFFKKVYPKLKEMVCLNKY